MTNDELQEFSSKYPTVDGMLGPTGGSLLIEAARRSTLTAHQRIADAASDRPGARRGAGRGGSDGEGH